MGGSMGCVFGEKITRQLESALDECISSGDRYPARVAREMLKGLTSLMQMAQTSAAVARLQTPVCHYHGFDTPLRRGVQASFDRPGQIIHGRTRRADPALRARVLLSKL
jgi:acetyl-CoA carboxylase carboxyl transferase subunit beta